MPRRGALPLEGHDRSHRDFLYANYSRPDHRHPTSRCSAAAGLQPTAAGYGFLLALDGAGEPYTAVPWDVEYVRLLLSAWEARDVTVPAEKVIGHIREWPWMWVGFAAWRAAAALSADA